MTNNNNLIIPKENKAQIVEIRYLEKQETLTHKFFKKILPTAYCMSDSDEWEPMSEKDKDDTKKIVGTELEVADAVVPPVGEIATLLVGATGLATKACGEATGNEQSKENGEIMTGATKKPFEDIKKLGEKAKEVFE